MRAVASTPRVRDRGACRAACPRDGSGARRCGRWVRSARAATLRPPMKFVRCALVLAAALASGCGSRAPKPETAQHEHTFAVGERDFLVDGRPFAIHAGALDSARVPPEYWSHRLALVRALGCN